MKKLLLFVLTVCAFASAHAQITVEHTYTVKRSMLPVHFTQYGYKFEVIDTGSNQMNLYNADYSFWKTITIPLNSGERLSNVYLVSDNLFNNDDLIELIVTVYLPATSSYNARLINENGVQSFDFGEYSDFALLNEDGHFKIYGLSVHLGLNYNYIDYTIYGLPGSVPCNACGGLGLKETKAAQPSLSAPTPNPTTGNFTINYNLPLSELGNISLIDEQGHRIAEYPVSADQNQIQVNMSGLPNGIYYYYLKSGSGVSDTKKVTLVK